MSCRIAASAAPKPLLFRSAERPTTKTEGRKADQHGEERGERGAERERRVRVDALQGQKRRRVRADPDERGVAERDLAREAAEDVPGRGEDHGERHVPEVVQRSAVEDTRREEEEDGGRDVRRGGEKARPHQVRSSLPRRGRRARSPGNPCGNATSTTTRSVKLIASWNDVGTVV